jgi:putative transcriptional regulator
MVLTNVVRAGVIAAALSLPAATVGAALQSPADSPQPDSLVGQLLVASPSMTDPRFFRSVILVVRHDRSGAFGIAINRPVGERPAADLLDAIGEGGSGATGTVRIFAGGPVEPKAAFVIHSTEYHRAETIDIDGHVAVTSTREILHDVAHGQGPKQTLVAFGYAGWRAGQLEDELKQGAWYMASQDAKLIFEEDRDKVWDDAVTRRTQDL